jgi:hypothetical protein
MLPSLSLKGLTLLGIMVLTSEALIESQTRKYSTNMLCTQNNCINPVFPGMQDIPALNASKWTCAPGFNTISALKFCAQAVQYNFSLVNASGNLSNTSVLSAAVQQQENMAISAYYFHLAGLNIEAWSNKDPANSTNPCLKAIWKMVCTTYFPEAPVSCSAGTTSKYTLPCQNMCSDYVSACSVECCDESVMCTPQDGYTYSGSYANFTGYYPSNGPSPNCTSASRPILQSSTQRSTGAPFVLATLLGLLSLMQGQSSLSSSESKSQPKTRTSSMILAITLMLVSFSLQGCEMDAHPAAAWESRPSYLQQFKSVVPVTSKNVPSSARPKAQLNSCGNPNLAAAQVCSGHGSCQLFSGSNASNTTTAAATNSSLYVCKCDRDWRDPECSTRRKSQFTAFLLAMFTGCFGGDMFYLGDVSTGIAKLSTFGGCGVWWAWDVVRIGSAPIESSEGRVAADLPHFLFVYMAAFWAMGLSYLTFGVFGTIYHHHRAVKQALLKAEKSYHLRHSAALPHLHEDNHSSTQSDNSSHDPSRFGNVRLFPPIGPDGLYGTMEAAPPEVRISGANNPASSYYHLAQMARRSGLFARPSF